MNWLQNRSARLLTVLALTPALTWAQWIGPRFFFPAEANELRPALPLQFSLAIALVVSLLIVAALPRLARALSCGTAKRRLVAVAALVGWGVAGWCLFAAAVAGPGGWSHRLRLMAGFSIGVGVVFGAALVKAWIVRFLESTIRYRATIALIAGSLAVTVHWCGMRQFGGFDHSMVIDFGWRLFSGQRPIADFPLTAPPSFFLGAYYAYELFGVSWRSLVLALALFSAVTFLWSIWILARFVESRWARLVIAFGTQALCVVPVSYWWYNPITTAAGVLFTFAACAWYRVPRSTAVQASYVALLVLVASTKPNVAPFLIFGATCVLLTSREHRGRVLVLSAIAFGIFLGWLRLHDLSLIDCLRGYYSVATQGLAPGPYFTNSRRFEVAVALLTLLYVLLPLLACGWFYKILRPEWRAAALGVSCVVAGLSNFVSAGETKLVDMGIVLMGVAVVAHACGAWSLAPSAQPRAGSQLLTAYLTGLILVTSCAGLAVGLTRDRVHGIGNKIFFEYALESDPFPSGYFRGLRTGRLFKETFAQVSAVVAASSGKSIFFGPRMQWGYAAFALPSPLRQPVWWHGGVSFPHRDMSMYVNRFVEQRYEVLIFLKNDMTYYPQELMAAIARDYSEDQSLSELTVFRLRAPAGGSAN